MALQQYHLLMFGSRAQAPGASHLKPPMPGHVRRVALVDQYQLSKYVNVDMVVPCLLET